MLNWRDKVVVILVLGIYVLIGAGILGGIVLLAWYEPWNLLDGILVITLVIVLRSLWRVLKSLLEDFPSNVETWPDWLRWVTILPVAAISVIVIFVDSIEFEHRWDFAWGGVFKHMPDWIALPLFKILRAVLAFVFAVAFIFYGTMTAPRFRVGVAALLGFLVLSVDFTLVLPEPRYFPIVVVATLAGVVVGWVATYNGELF